MWGDAERERDHKKDACAMGDRVARLRVTIPGLFHRIHSASRANLKHICCSCSCCTAFGTSFTASLEHPLLLLCPSLRFVLAMFLFECLHLRIDRLSLSSIISPYFALTNLVSWITDFLLSPGTSYPFALSVCHLDCLWPTCENC